LSFRHPIPDDRPLAGPKEMRMTRRFPFLAAALVAAPLLATGIPGDPPATSSGDLDLAAIESSVAGALDREADPCDDFYRFACGNWIDAVELPADQPIWVRSFSVIHEQNRELLRELIEDAAKDPGDDPDRGRVGRTYAACMDEAAIEKAGLAPLAPWLAKIDAAPDRAALFALGAELQQINVGAFFSIGVDGDFKEPQTVVAHFAQGGMGLPERDYYLSDDEKQVAIREAYRAYVAKMLGLLGAPEEQAQQEADAVVAFETQLAEASRSAEQMREYDKLHNRLNAAGLVKLAPGLPWKATFAALGDAQLEAINVMTPEFFEALDKTVAEAPIETLRAYLRVQLGSATAALLPDEVYQASFDFFDRTLTGQQEPQPRWKRCVSATEAAVGQALGRLYVAERFTGRSKEIVLSMIGDITDAFAAGLPGLDWMDEPTRKAAIGKKEALRFRIGYPNAWRDYSSLAMDGGHFANVVAARRFESERQIEKVGKPLDRDDWSWNPQVVNAGYDPLRNDHTYPAGILQPPFFHKDYPAPMNYGAIGYVIGHELTHGFDDQGRKFDAGGHLTDWWTPASVEKFEERAQCVADAYDTFEVEPGIHVNGELTLGENIADIGGLKESWNAFQAWKARQTKPVEGLAGLTADQLFFVSAAQVWCTDVAPEYSRMLVQVDPHSPSDARVLRTMQNQPSFARAFSCEEGAPMNPTAKCEVW